MSYTWQNFVFLLIEKAIFLYNNLNKVCLKSQTLELKCQFYSLVLRKTAVILLNVLFNKHHVGERSSETIIVFLEFQIGFASYITQQIALYNHKLPY